MVEANLHFDQLKIGTFLIDNCPSNNLNENIINCWRFFLTSLLLFGSTGHIEQWAKMFRVHFRFLSYTILCKSVFVLFSVGHCNVCSSINIFWISLWYLLTFLTRFIVENTDNNIIEHICLKTQQKKSHKIYNSKHNIYKEIVFSHTLERSSFT